MRSPSLHVEADTLGLVLPASSCDISRQNGAFWEKGKTL